MGALNRLAEIYRKYDLSQENLHISPREDCSIDVWFDCSDTFSWATAEGHTLYPQDLDALEQAAKDLEEVDTYASVYSEILWIARDRKSIPMEQWLRQETNDNFKLRALFDSVKGE
jgi:hypothetical protein